MQWPSTSRSVFDQEKAASVVVDLMYKVHTTHPDLLMLCCQLLQHHNSTKVIPTLVPRLSQQVELYIVITRVYFRGSFASPPPPLKN